MIETLRHFHYGEPAAARSTQLPDSDMLPALLHPYRDSSAIRYQYPLYLAPADCPPDTSLAAPLGEHLVKSIEDFALSDEAARILRDNLTWLERYLRECLTGDDPVDAPALFDQAAEALQEHLDLGDRNRESLAADLASLRAAIIDGSRFLAYGPDAPLHLLLHAIRHRDERGREQLRSKIADGIRVLDELLQVEAAKSDAETAGDAGPEIARIDTSKLSSMLEKRAQGSVVMEPERRARVEKALADLRSWQDDPVLVRFVGNIDSPAIADSDIVEIIPSDDPCATAREVFAKEAVRYATLFTALRIAELEKEDKYKSSVHDSWFAGFDWQAFSDDELQSLPRVVAIVSADYLAADGLPSFSHLLGSRLPVHIVSWVRAYDNPAIRPGEDAFDCYRFELAYFGVGHRQVAVAQTSAARHDEMLDGFQGALASNRTSLHLVNRGTQTQAQKPILDPWFVASAALESRAHPSLLIDPNAGDRAAERVNFGGNPQPEADWPVETLEYEDDAGERQEMPLAFTFADYALLMPALHAHFRTVPEGLDAEDLVPIAEYLEADAGTVERLIPFVWGIGADGKLARLVISRALVFACRDRLNYWRTLQELAGVHNFYVETAVERVLEDARAAAESEREELLKAHEEELDSARSEAAGEAMGQLVDVLMGADLSSMISDAPVATMPATEAEAVPAEAVPAETVEEPEPEPEEEEEELSFDEPWLDTASCTTCDDCMSINKQMFVYNDDKQAILKDPKAGPYSDLVKAAEICPAQCIHPGKPLDPNEPGLEELIARAAPFN
jgi:ferredoxin